MSIIFSELVYQLQARSKEVRGKFISRELKGKTHRGWGERGDRPSPMQDAVFPFPATTSSPDPARLIFEHSLAQAKGKR